MRPEILFPLFAPVSSIKGVGAKMTPLVEAHIGKYVRDVIFLKPQAIVSRPLATADTIKDGETQTLKVVIQSNLNKIRHNLYKAISYVDNTRIDIIYFRPLNNFDVTHPIGAERLISGRIERSNGGYTVAHPDYLLPVGRADEIPRIEPIYPATYDLSSKFIRKIIHNSICDDLSLNAIDDKIFKSNALSSLVNLSISRLHAPLDENDLLPEALHHRQLAYSEALAHQVAMSRRRQSSSRTLAQALVSSPDSDTWLASLPFEPTGAQSRVLSEVRTDLASGWRMNRLIQGDVGAGKTLIAFAAMLDVAYAGHQSVIMAPTEVLARQHFVTASKWLSNQPFELALLTGRDKGSVRSSKRRSIENGSTRLVFGTHAVFQEGVNFHSLRLAVIDEQHRFGVEQRRRLFAKGEQVHVLSMSATPIPRTLALTRYGECDLSVLDEKPVGRIPIQTAVVPRARISEVVERLSEVIARGAQAYWICPLIEESEETDLIAVEARHAALKEALNVEIGLVHGRMTSEDKDSVMGRFKDGQLPVLCATTVVEVGVDVPNASIIIIEQPERFGLAQLHQLRGRVGRGQEKSVCILLYDNPLSQEARKRLELLRETEDGFRIAEADWKMRGEGDILGLKQSGFPDYWFVDPVAHADLIDVAAKEGRYVVEYGHLLSDEQKEGVEILLHLFDRQDSSLERLD